ncbi:sporulation-specific wall maturation protein [Monosporozyma servazzii]
MKLQVFISFLVALSSLASSALVPDQYGLYQKKSYLYRRQNMTGGGTTGNASNGTSGGGGGSSGSGSVPIIVVGGGSGGGGASNASSGQAMSNFTGILNTTQLYSISSQVNQSLTSSSSSNGVVIVAGKKSLESIAFFLAITTNTNKTIVVCNDQKLGQVVAMSEEAQGRGPLIVGKQKIIYSGTLPPWGVPDGVIDDSNQAHWFTNACPPLLTAWNSTLRTQYTNFTSTESNSNNAIVPIVYEEGIAPSLLQSVSSFIQGLVVISSGSNSTTTEQSVSIPVVYTQPKGKPISFIDNSTIPSNAIAGGYLSPVQAQILLSIAVSNGVNNTQSLKQIFPL